MATYRKPGFIDVASADVVELPIGLGNKMLADRIEKLERELGCSWSDIEIAKRNGMVAWDVIALREYCVSKGNPPFISSWQKWS